MRYLLVLPLVLMFLAGCSKSDRETINGTWTFYELKGPDGKMMYSADKAEQKKITDETVKEQLPMMAAAGYDEAKFRDMIAKQFTAIGKTTFTFDEKGTVKTGGAPNAEKAPESKFTLDEKKKTITIKAKEGEELKYTYTFKDDKLTMKGAQEEFILQKK